MLRPVQLLLALHLTTAKAPLLGCDEGISYTVGGLKDGGSTMTMEQRMDRLEKRNKRLTVVGDDGCGVVRRGDDGGDRADA